VLADSRPRLTRDPSLMALATEQTQMPRADLLAFDPYSPVAPVPTPERNDTDPLALDPLSPTWPAWPDKRLKWAV
jgi:hypothetical protein